MSRKNKAALRNLGGTFGETVERYFKGPTLASARTSIVLLERLFLAILRSEIERLSEDKTELERFFSHFFDPTAGTEERDRFVDNFIRQPPVAVLGYPRTTATFPCFSIILESEEEDTTVLEDYVGQTLPGESGGFPGNGREAYEYKGAVFKQSYGIYIYAQHPDVCGYLYQFAKFCMFGSHDVLVEAGMIDFTLSGGELSPEEMYLPDNMFARVLRISSTAVQSIPQLLNPDPARIKLAGVFMDDVVVDGIRGGVTPYAPEDSDDGT